MIKGLVLGTIIGLAWMIGMFWFIRESGTDACAEVYQETCVLDVVPRSVWLENNYLNPK